MTMTISLDFKDYKNDCDILDATVSALHLQGKPARDNSFGGSGACCYRTAEGLKCALGMWIPDELYLNDLEDNDAYGVLFVLPDAWARHGYPDECVRRQARQFLEWLARHIGVLSDLQDLHDEYLGGDEDCFERQVAFLRGKHGRGAL